MDFSRLSEQVGKLKKLGQSILGLAKSSTRLTLKWSRPSALPLVVKGGSLWTLTQESTFPNEFGGKMQATDKVIQNNQNTAKKSKIGYTITKWRPKNQFLSRDKKFSTKNGKTSLTKEFFLEILGRNAIHVR